MNTQQNKNNIKKPKIRLPFDDKKTDMGEWAFDHRSALCITVIAYLLFGIAFVSSKIFVGTEQHTKGFYIDIEDIAALEEMRDKLEEEVTQKQEFDWESVSNKASNEYSQEQTATNDKGLSSTNLSGEAAKAKEVMEANKKAYQDALDNIETERENTRQKGAEEAAERRDVKRSGNVTVSYSFNNPVRHAQDLVVPAYQCQGGGEVVVTAQLNSKGQIIEAEIARGGDKCMQETALKAARGSRFNPSSDAPNPQVGTITYIFIPQ